MSSVISASRKIIGIGRNYAQHAVEMGMALPTEPMMFLKPPSSFITAPSPIEIPKGCVVHHEIELGVVIGRTGRDIKASEADSFISGYLLALDMTARNKQSEAAKAGHPWTIAKGYDSFCPISEFIPKNKVKDSSKLDIVLKVDGVVRQEGSTKDMVFDVATLIAYISKIMTLEKGDVILTGTPEGVGKVVAGEVLTASLTDSKTSTLLSEIEFKVVDRI